MSVRKIFVNMLALVAVLAAAGCRKDELNLNPKNPGKTGDEGDARTELVSEPGKCDNKIVAHRGGSSECGQPDNSRASLRYAMSLKIMASECDIYWTKDNNIVIGHASSDYKINGMLPWEHTLEEIQKAGLLKNGETLPSLDDFLDIVMTKGNCTKLWLDIKLVSPNDYSSKAVQRACEIIKARKAEKFCEFICTGNTTVAKVAAQCMTAYGIPVGWMGNQTPATHKANGFTWANLSAKSHMYPYGARTIDEFVNAGMEISVFNVDKSSGDGNAVTSASDVKIYIDNYPKIKAICTNYPKWLKSQL